MRRNNATSVVVATTAVLLIVAAMFGVILPLLFGKGKGSLTSSSDFIKTSSGLQYQTTRTGRGDVPIKGQTVEAHYTGWLNGFNMEPAFDSSRRKNKPFTFRLGAGQVIQGWDEGIATMRVGERRQLIIPSELGYGSRGAGGGVIPGGATLYFDVELLSIR